MISFSSPSCPPRLARRLRMAAAVDSRRRFHAGTRRARSEPVRVRRQPERFGNNAVVLSRAGVPPTAVPDRRQHLHPVRAVRVGALHRLAGVGRDLRHHWPFRRAVAAGRHRLSRSAARGPPCRGSGVSGEPERPGERVPAGRGGAAPSDALYVIGRRNNARDALTAIALGRSVRHDPVDGDRLRHRHGDDGPQRCWRPRRRQSSSDRAERRVTPAAGDGPWRRARDDARERDERCARRALDPIADVRIFDFAGLIAQAIAAPLDFGFA